jgi:hypothetical protein
MSPSGMYMHVLPEFCFSTTATASPDVPYTLHSFRWTDITLIVFNMNTTKGQLYMEGPCQCAA